MAPVMRREVLNHWSGHCFGCSTANSHGLGLRFYLSENGSGCYTKCSIPDYLCGVDGIVHGGITALLLDEVSQWTMIARTGKMGLTREIAVRYIKPVPTNTEIIVEANINDQDDRNTVLQSSVRSTDGEVLAEGKSTWMMANLSVIAKVSKLSESQLREFLAHYPVATS